MAKILILDGDLSTRVVMKHALDCYEVVLAEGSNHAIALAVWAQPDLLILDTEYDGIIAARKILQEMKVPIIFTSSNYESLVIPADITNSQVMPKPFDPLKLRAEVGFALIRRLPSRMDHQNAV